MKKLKHRLKFAIVPILLFTALTAEFTGSDNDIYFEIAKNIDIFTRVYKDITFNYVDEIEPEQFLRAGIKGMLSELDPYTVFMDETRQDDIDLLTNGKYGGIGVSIGVRDDKVTILELMDGYSAERQGLHIGDVIISVSGTPITGENFDEISTYVKGEPGTFVDLKILRGESKDTLEFNLVREEVVVKNVTYYGFYPEESNIGYIKLSSFTRSAADELKRALNDLKARKEVHSIIIDLRNNPGGLLDAAIDISNKFLPKGDLIVSTKGRDSTSLKHFYADQEPIMPDAHLIVLVNNGSASASEIVAGAIQDHDRGIILGEKTFGKGLVQTIQPLSYNTSLKITTSRYFTPSGRSIQKVDYARNNAVIASYDTLINKAFFTDNQREVRGFGGIAPDSSVDQNNYSELTKDLLAKGLLFEFANHYYNNNGSNTYETLDFNKVYKEFTQFLETKNYRFKNELEDQLTAIIFSIKEDKRYDEVEEKLVDLTLQVDEIAQQSIEYHKDEIVKELKVEFAARYLGNEGKIIESLKHDTQFSTAIKILENQESYSRLLNSL